MKKIFFLLFFPAIFFSCKTKKVSVSNVEVPTANDTIEPPNYFRVTDFLRGQLTEIKNDGVNPLRYTIKAGKTDSVWLKIEDLPAEVADFLTPVIDTTNLVDFYKEEKFLDRSVEAFTFTYSPIGKLPDTIQLKHWDVYVNPKTGKVMRIYMVKQKGPDSQQQLTWQAEEEKWCRITNISTKADGSLSVDNEKKITWNF